MYTPGYEEENKFKPKITLKIEEADDGLTPDLAALALFKGKHSHCLSMEPLSSIRIAWIIPARKPQALPVFLRDIFE